MKLTRLFLVIGVTVLGLGVGRASADPANPGVIPISGVAQGHTYGELAAAWWKWATETPTPQNAVVDETGANCASNQNTAGVWFLAGTFGGSVTRSCTVPNGTFFYFPLANDFYGAFLTDPPDQRTEAFVRSQTECIIGAVMSAEIDGVAVVNPSQYLEQSPLFTIHLPTDNVFGVTADEVPALTLDPTVDRGYYLYLAPLAPGSHTIHFTTSPGASCAIAQDVTYHLTVK